MYGFMYVNFDIFIHRSNGRGNNNVLTDRKKKKNI